METMTAEPRTAAQEYDERIKRLILILLLLLFLLFAMIAWLLLSGGRVSKAAPGIEHIFSIYGFDRPLAVAADKSNNIYVSDTGHDKYFVFDDNGQFVKRIGNDKRHIRFYGIVGSKIDSDGKIYINDFKRRSIYIFSKVGKFIRRFPGDYLNVRVYGRSGFSPFGMDIYNNKIYTTSNDGIYIFSKAGKLLKKIGSEGKGVGQFYFPSAIAVNDKDGSMYVTDQLNRRVVAMSRDGNVKWVLGKPDENGSIVGFFGLPKGIEVDKEGLVYVTDAFHNEIIILSPEGKLISVLGKRGVEDGNFNFPEGLVFDDLGRIILADRENDRVQIIRITDFIRPSQAELKKYRKSFIKTSG